ncbi:aspartyl protease family protein [Actinoplanes sp. HUAS TT8]|uniref:aspartyl protease family protein n=1 Tax=Actinoplanes sp. HUAS TT8 TaxID=3447453 RepID=UPI003F51EE4C
MDGVPLVVETDPVYPDCATVLVDGTIAGRPYRFVLDTGAARTHLTADDELARLAQRGSQQSSALVGTRHENLLLLPELTIGPRTWTDLEISSVEADHPGQRNLLGMDAIGASAGRFDLARGSWQPVPTGTLPTRWPLARGSRGHSYVDVAWPGVTARALWDTGADITVVDSGFYARNPELFRFAGNSTGTDGTGAVLEGPTYWLDEVRIGDRTFAPHRAFVADLPQDVGHMDLVLGYPAIRQAVWVFDFPARRWAIE